MIRLFASDLDGTLLNALHRTDPVVLRSIARVRQAGLHFSLATGRTLRSGRQMGFAGNVCVVCANGAIVLDEGGAPIRTRSLDPTFVQELAAAFPTAPLEFVTVRHTYHLQSLEQHRASLGMAPLPTAYFAFLALVAAGYVACVAVAKRLYLRSHETLL